ncbi:MAG TPA: hypothetical protein VJN65_04130 [Bacteroidota bacterium]|nr:hypothetical protein [Bacteroidota bacterium]
MKTPFVLLIVIEFAVTQLPLAGCSSSKDQARPISPYDSLIVSGSFAKMPTSEDSAYVRAIQANPGSITQRLVTDLSFPKKGELSLPRAVAIFHILPSLELKLPIARSAIETYPVGGGAPLLEFLGAYGGAPDTSRLRQEIAFAPDGRGVGIALAIVQLKNAVGMALLKDMQGSTPGAWQDALK